MAWSGPGVLVLGSVNRVPAHLSAMSPVYTLNASEAVFSSFAPFGSIGKLHFAGVTYARIQNRDIKVASARDEK